MATQILGPTPTEILSEHISDTLLRRNAENQQLKQILSAALIAFRCVYLSAAAGNVRCQEAVEEIEKICPTKLPK